MGGRMLKQHRVSPVCSLAWQHCTLYSCNIITHSSSGRRLKFNTFVRHFYYLLLSFHSRFSPHTLSHLYSCFCVIAPSYIIFYSPSPLSPSPSPPCWARLWPPWLFITPPLCICHSLHAGATLGLALSPSLSPAYLFILDPWNKTQPDVWLPEAVGRWMQIYLRCPFSPSGRCAGTPERYTANPGLWEGEVSILFLLCILFSMQVLNDIPRFW